MPSVKLPIARPGPSAAPDSISAAFDYLPANQSLPYTTADEVDLYTSRFHIDNSAYNAGANRIEHIFPNMFVRFVADIAALPAPMEDLVNAIANEKFGPPFAPIRGNWFALGTPRTNQNYYVIYDYNVVPTVFVYHQVLLDQTVFLNTILPAMDISINADVPEDLDESDIEALRKLRRSLRLSKWLSGEARIHITAQFDNAPLPQIPLVGGIGELALTALMVDNFGVDMSTLERIFERLSSAKAIGNRFYMPNPPHGLPNPTHNLATVPLASFYQRLESGVIDRDQFAVDHMDHLLIDSWLQNSVWRSVLFTSKDFIDVNYRDLNTTSQDITVWPLGEAQDEPNPELQGLECTLNGTTRLEVPGSGLLFFRSSQQPDVISLTRNGVALELNHYNPVNGEQNDLSIDLNAMSYKDLNRIIIGNLTFPQTANRYFGVTPAFTNLQDFIDAVTMHKGYTLTWAGAFARTMGFIGAMMYAEMPPHFQWPPEHRHRRESIFLSIAYQLFAHDWHRGWPYEILNPIDEITREVLEEKQLTITHIMRPQWMNTHYDGYMESGWKVFNSDSFDTTGRHDHFLTNAGLAFYTLVRGEILAPMGEAVGEKTLNDEKFNEVGRAFGNWLDGLQWQPSLLELVEEWLLEYIVDRPTIG